MELIPNFYFLDGGLGLNRLFTLLPRGGNRPGITKEQGLTTGFSFPGPFFSIGPVAIGWRVWGPDLPFVNPLQGQRLDFLIPGPNQGKRSGFWFEIPLFYLGIWTFPRRKHLVGLFPWGLVPGIQTFLGSRLSKRGVPLGTLVEGSLRGCGPRAVFSREKPLCFGLNTLSGGFSGEKKFFPGFFGGFGDTPFVFFTPRKSFWGSLPQGGVFPTPLFFSPPFFFFFGGVDPPPFVGLFPQPPPFVLGYNKACVS